MIRILNKKAGGKGEYCGRPSPLGNPFAMRDESERNEVCDRYDEWLKVKLRMKDPAVLAELRRLYAIYTKTSRLSLVCWCAPSRCHCESIRAVLLQKAETDRC